MASILDFPLLLVIKNRKVEAESQSATAPGLSPPYALMDSSFRKDEPDWISCFCDVWPGVIYSPTGPLFPASIIQSLMGHFRGPQRRQETEMPKRLLKLQSDALTRDLTEDEVTDIIAFYNMNPVRIVSCL